MEYQVIDRVLEEMKSNASIRDRRIYLDSEIDRESIFKCVYYLQRLKDLDDKDNIPTKERLPIEIIIDSYGGYIYHGNALLSKIKQMKEEYGYHIICTVNSVAMSMGFMTLIVASERRALRYSTILCHQPSGACAGTLRDMEEQLKETQRLWQLMKDIIKEHTNITEDKLESMKKGNEDWTLSPEQALELGIIDKII